MNANDFWQQTLDEIPLLNYMNVTLTSYQRMPDDGKQGCGAQLRLDAPLAPNKNDKQTGFGGSLASLATICGWALTALELKNLELAGEIVIVESTMNYKAPITDDFYATGQILPTEQQCFLQQLNDKGRAKLDLTIAVKQRETVAAELRGQYRAKLVSAKKHGS